jgi:translation initiation factor 1
VPGKNDRPKIVYSTDPGWQYMPKGPPGPPALGLPRAEGQTAYVSLDRRAKGKGMTVVEGIEAHPDDLAALAKKLKTRCGCGGTSREGRMEVQGDKRDEVARALEEWGYRVKRKGG